MFKEGMKKLNNGKRGLNLKNNLGGNFQKFQRYHLKGEIMYLVNLTVIEESDNSIYAFNKFEDAEQNFRECLEQEVAEGREVLSSEEIEQAVKEQFYKFDNGDWLSLNIVEVK